MSNNHQELLNNGAAVGPQGEGMDSPSTNAGSNLNNGAAVGPQGEGMKSAGHFPAYPAYKNSGADWLGMVPEHWESRRLKFLFKLQKRSVSDSDGIVTCFRDGAVTLRSNRRTDGFTNAEKEIGYQGIRKGDLVIHAMDAFAGAIGVSDSDGKSSPVYSACTPNDGVSAYYYARLLRHMALAGFVASLAKGIRERSTDFRWSDASEIYLPLPSISEQTQIARFLDHETARIDALISEQQRLIELLKEKRQAVISHAVTKGLNPNAPMKDSGVEWLGQVPAHWDICPLKHLAQVKGRIGFRGYSADDLVLEDEGALIVGATEMTASGEIELIAPQFISWQKYYESPEIMLNEGDLLIVQRGSTVGKVACFSGYQKQATINPSLIVLKKININSKFLLSALQADYVQSRFSLQRSSTAIPMISQEQVENYKIAFPPLHEQIAINEHLAISLAKLDQLIGKSEEIRNLLSERRSALISAAVTGKIDVRGWQPPVETRKPQQEPAAV